MTEPTNGKHVYSCCVGPRGCAWPDRHTQPCTLHHGCGASHGVTEQPNTAEIRERWAAWSPAPMAPGGTILALCDALDAARAEQDIRRAESAEARIVELERRLHPGQGEGYANEVERHRVVIEQLQHVALKQKARIAAALAWFADTDCTWTYRVEMARRALTEGADR